MDITPEQQRKINKACSSFQQKIQNLVNKKGSGIDGISMTFGGKTVQIATKKKGES